MTTHRTPLALAALALSLVPQLALAQRLTLRADEVVPVVMEQTLSIQGSRDGDRFFARVADDRDLPRGTRFEGRVVRIRESRDSRDNASVDLEFTHVILPGNKRQAIDAIPIPLTDAYVARGGDGRFVAKKEANRKEKRVFGGLLGGLLVGSIVKKPTEGAILGLLAGIASAEFDKGGDGNIVLKSGSKIGVLFERNATLTWDRRDERDDRDWRDDRGRRDDRDWRDRDRRDEDRDWGWDREEREVAFRHGDRDLTFNRDARPYRDGDCWMVPLDRTSSQMGFRTDRIGRVFFIESESALLKAELDSREYRLNGRRSLGARGITERRGVVYVPMSMLAGMCEQPLTIDGVRVRIED